MAILVGILLSRKTMFARLVSFTSSSSSVSNAEELCLGGLLSPEEKVRTDFERSLGVLA